MTGYNGAHIGVTLFGQSHGESVGVTLTGVPAGERLDLAQLQSFLERRAPGRAAYATARRESDVPEFLSGLCDGVTDGAAITAIIKNEDVRPQDYAPLRALPRPGHADFTAYMKYNGAHSTGGGCFSGRMTAPLCVAGGICAQLLAREGVSIISRIAAIGEIEDEGELSSSTAGNPFPTVSKARGELMLRAVENASAAGDSLGGVIECAVLNAPVGLGGALFDGLEGRIALLALAVPAIKGVEFGAGFAAAKMRGSENNDAFAVENGRVVTVTNNCGGILGGISDGMPIVFRVAVKPTPSISAPQRSVDLLSMRETELRVGGRHDACIVPRAVPCVEAVAAIALYDALLQRKRELGANTLAVCRAELDAADAALTAAFVRRMELSARIADIKKKDGLCVRDEEREREKLARAEKTVPTELGAYTRALYDRLFELSREYQQSLMTDNGKEEK